MHTIIEARELNEFARDVFLRDGSHRAMVIFFRRGETVAILDATEFMQSDETKNELIQVICDEIHQRGISAVAVITEAWMRRISTSSREEMRKAFTTRVEDMSDRQEILLVKVESDDGLDVTFSNPIVRDGVGKPTLGKAEENNDFKGRLGGFLNRVPIPISKEN